MLPFELLDIIFREVTSPVDILSCVLTCKAWKEYLTENDERLFKRRCWLDPNEIEHLTGERLRSRLQHTSVESTLGPFFNRWYTSFLVKQRLRSQSSPIRVRRKFAKLVFDTFPESFDQILHVEAYTFSHGVADPTEELDIRYPPTGVPASEADINVRERRFYYRGHCPDRSSHTFRQGKNRCGYPEIKLDPERKPIRFVNRLAIANNGYSIYRSLGVPDALGHETSYLGVFWGETLDLVKLWEFELPEYATASFVLGQTAIAVISKTKLYLYMLKSSRDKLEINLCDRTAPERSTAIHFVTDSHIFRLHKLTGSIHIAPLAELCDSKAVAWKLFVDAKLSGFLQDKNTIHWNLFPKVDNRYICASAYRISFTLKHYHYFMVIDLLTCEARVYYDNGLLGSHWIVGTAGQVGALTRDTVKRLFSEAKESGRDVCQIDMRTMKITN
ncbi:hypothetical protein TRVA0_012S00298 [Trichomonascus vanleenenianus]|uniref:F-box protein n=1 Tax=Trichomonascus vanleenenianus TaxID=2268995 RepID=UPI003ECB6C1E